MLTDTIATFFLPAAVRHDKTHPRYTELYVVANACVLGLAFLLVAMGVMQYVHLSLLPLHLLSLSAICVLLSLRFFGHYRIPMSLTAIGGLVLVYEFIRASGMIFSVNVNLLHMYLLMALLADKKWGWLLVFACLGLLLYVYAQTPPLAAGPAAESLTNTPVYALLLHSFITVSLGGVLGYANYTEEQNRLKIQGLQSQKISLLDEAVKQRTAQLNTMRQAMAADFHDETGNVLAAITRQAALLELQFYHQPEALPIIRSIIDNSNRLYASSKDFLWDLNHQSDNPQALFHYLTAYGQQFYNQFDVAFSAESPGPATPTGQLPPSASLNLIYIFKEAMGNVIKHAAATDVVLRLLQVQHEAVYSIQDNGRWAEPDETTAHYGLHNMRYRCQKQGFAFEILPGANGTRIEIRVPLHTTFIS